MTRRRVVLGAAACVLAVGAIVVTQVDFGTGADSHSSARQSASAPGNNAPGPSLGPGGRRELSGQSKAAKRADNPLAGPVPAIEPAKMLPGGSGFLSGEIMSPDNGGWRAGSHTAATVVEAGGDAQQPSDGLFSIIRENNLKVTQTTDLVRVAGSGPVTITKAPLGGKVVASAQKHGNIEFKSKSGITGTLQLKDDTITLNP